VAIAAKDADGSTASKITAIKRERGAKSAAKRSLLGTPKPGSNTGSPELVFMSVWPIFCPDYIVTVAIPTPDLPPSSALFVGVFFAWGFGP
jgi:hypothetical protein